MSVKTLDYHKTSPVDGKSQTAPSSFHYAVISQGKAKRNPLGCVFTCNIGLRLSFSRFFQNDIGV